MIKVGEIKTRGLAPIVDEKYNKFFDSKPEPYEATMEIRGTNTSVLNAMRITMMEELLVKSLYVDFEKYVVSDDEYLLSDKVADVIRLIPISQSAHGMYHIDVSNSGQLPIIVYSDSIKSADKNNKKIMSKTVPLCSLQPGRHLKISNIKIISDYGYNHVANSLAFAVRALPQDIKMYDMYTGEGVSCSAANPQVFNFIFECNGWVAARDIVKDTLENILERLKTITQKMVINAYGQTGKIITIDGESDGFGVLFVRTLSEMGITSSYKIETIPRKLILRIIDTSDVIEKAINKMIHTYELIMAQI